MSTVSDHDSAHNSDRHEPADPRERLVRAGTRVIDELPLPKVFAGATTAAVAGAAGVTTGSFFHHFPTSAEFVDAVVLSTIPAPEDLLEQVDELVDSLDHIDLLEVMRLNLKDTWEVHRSEESMRRTLRLQYLLWSHHAKALSRDHDGMSTVADVLRTSYRVRHDQAVAGWKHLLVLTGRTFIEPFDMDRIAVALTALFEGLLARQQVDPDAVDDTLFADISAALATSLTVPRGSRLRLADLGEPLVDQSRLSPQARSGARRRRETRRRITDAATGLFDEGWESVPASEIAEAAEVSNQTVLNLFRSVQEVAAVTFVRHVADLQGVAEETAGDPPLVALHRVLMRLADHAQADAEPARALLAERVAAKLHHGGELLERDIRLEVPIVQALLPSVERLDLDGAEPIHVVAMLTDTVLSLALNRVYPIDDVAGMAMRLLPPSATGAQQWTPWAAPDGPPPDPPTGQG